MNKFKNLIAVTLILILSFSCSDDLPIDNVVLGDYQDGYFIVNEGPFSSGSGTLSFVDNNGVVTHNIYKSVNNEDLGNIVQSMNFYGNNAYIVINNSHKVVVANRYTMEKIAIIEGNDINNPRHFVAINGKGYISNWGDSSITTDDFITVIDLNSNTISSTIAVGEGPEDMLINDEKLYVNLQGGYGFNNQVVVIDTNTDSISSSITVGDVPNDISIDKNGDIWVLCSGIPSWSTLPETIAQLVRIKNDAVLVNFDFNAGESPSHLAINATKDVFYYNLNGKIYKQPIATASPFIELPAYAGFYYGLQIKNNKLYTLNGGDFVSEGTLKIFNLNTTDTETITTGIIPNAVIFQ